MKKRISTLALSLAIIMLLSTVSTSALAATGNSHDRGVYSISVKSGYMLTPLTKDGANAESSPGKLEAGGSGVIYKDVEKFKFTFSGKASTQYIVFLLSGGTQVPTESNIRYINQYTGASTVECVLYPDKLEPGAYSVCVSGGGTYEKNVATFIVAGKWTESDVIPGDVDGNGVVNSIDALQTLQIAAETISPTESQRLAADVDGTRGITSLDALKILNMAAEIA